MKRVIVIALFFAANVHAASLNGFMVSVVQDDKPVREFKEILRVETNKIWYAECYGGGSDLIIHTNKKQRVAIPFDSEYKIRLKNTHGRRATAKVEIDGAEVSKLGDFVVPANGEIDLERFVDASLTEGKKFKFVKLDHPDVDDPSRPENGLVRVTFKLEKPQALEIYMPIPPLQWTPPPAWWTNIWTITNGIIYCPGVFIDTTTHTTTSCGMTDPGATVSGGDSSQSFRKVSVDTEDEETVVELWIRGIKEPGSERCPNCGQQLKEENNEI